MKSYNYVYLPYNLSRNVNYIYLLCLYCVAERVDDCKTKSDIEFNSFAKLEEKINATLSKFQKQGKDGKPKTMVSASTLSRITKNEEYKDFFTYYKFGNNNDIILNNDFTKRINGDKCPIFVRLSPAMVFLLLEVQDNLLAQYIIYLVHYCSISGNDTNFTAKQFLHAAGYSTNSNSYVSKLCEYNALLQKRGIIKIKMYRDEDGKQRNRYSLQNYAFSPYKVVFRDSPEGDDPKSNFIF